MIVTEAASLPADLLPDETNSPPSPAIGKLGSALAWARRGFRVFPVHPLGFHYRDEKGKDVTSDGKHPAITGWTTRATTNEDLIRRWWSGPNADRNIGLAMGDQLPDGRYLMALDVDMKLNDQGGLKANGEASLRALCATPDIGTNLARLLRTLTQWTPSGARPDGSHDGGHLILSSSRPLGNTHDALGPGLDTRGAGGYIVAAGSEIDGRPYLVVDWSAPILELPEAIEAQLSAAPAKSPDRAPLPGVDPDRAEARAREFLTTAAGAPEGSRGSTAYRLAARLRDFGNDEPAAYELMAELWADRCAPPMPLEDLAESVNHAYRYAREPQGIAAPEAVFPPVQEPPPPEQESTPARHLSVLRWSDFMDRPVPPVRWVCDPYFPWVPFGVLASHPGHGKSYLALQLAVAVATGLPIFGLTPTGPAGAGILALEDDANVIHRRLKAIRNAYRFAWTPEHDALMDKHLRIMVRGSSVIDGANAESHLHQLHREIIQDMEGTNPAVLFIDTLNSVHSGDENDNTAVRPLVATIFKLHDALGCSVWALHHLRKAGTGRNAPALTDRLDPELVRGAGALVASARAVVQFGWLSPTEAGKAGLEAEGAQRRYAVMGLTKVNDGPLSPWTLLEHSNPAGLWVPVEGGEQALATLRGGGAVEKLRRAECILLDLAAGSTDTGELAEKYFPEDSKGPNGKLKTILGDMRKPARGGWLKPRSIELTEAGLRKVAELKSRQVASDAYLDSEEPSNDADL